MRIKVNNFNWNLDNSYIEHSQRLGAKWGVMNGPPYPLDYNQLSSEQKKEVQPGEFKTVGGVKTAISKIKNGIVSVHEKHKEEKHQKEVAEKRKAALEKARATQAANREKAAQEAKEAGEKQKAAEQHEKDRQEALKSGNLSEIQKYISESSASELNEALNKARVTQQITDAINRASGNQQRQSDPESEARRDALGSGDIKRIREVASDPNVSYQDLQNAVNKANFMSSMNSANKKGNPVFEAAEKGQAKLNKMIGYYNTGTQLWNAVASAYNMANRDKMVDDMPLFNSNVKTFTKEDKLKRLNDKKRAVTVQQAISTGDLEKISAQFGNMTNQEIRDAKDRFQNINAINNFLKSKDKNKK